MTTLKQILCAILNWGHPYEEKDYGDIIYFPEMDYFIKNKIIHPNKKICSCGKVWEKKR